MPNEKKRYRFSVPDADTAVIRWIDSQENLSYSLRALIKDSVARQGYIDVTCCEPSSKSPGRPKKYMQDALDRAEAGNLYGDSDNDRQLKTVSMDLTKPAKSASYTPPASQPEPSAPAEHVQSEQPVYSEPAQQPAPDITPQPAVPVDNQPVSPAVGAEGDDDMAAMFDFRRRR